VRNCLLYRHSQALSAKVDQQLAAARRAAVNSKKQLDAKDVRIQKLKEEIEAITKEKAALDRDILNVQTCGKSLSTHVSCTCIARGRPALLHSAARTLAPWQQRGRLHTSCCAA